MAASELGAGRRWRRASTAARSRPRGGEALAGSSRARPAPPYVAPHQGSRRPWSAPRRRPASARQAPCSATAAARKDDHGFPKRVRPGASAW